MALYKLAGAKMVLYSLACIKMTLNTSSMLPVGAWEAWEGFGTSPFFGLLIWIVLGPLEREDDLHALRLGCKVILSNSIES